jgi:predicted transposase/invertase (TIGR01784 family)
MSQNQMSSVPETIHITEEQARKDIQSLNLINGFLFDSVLVDEEDAKIVIGYILSTTYNRKVEVESVTSQKVFQATDTKYHSIRLDAYVKTSEDKSSLNATIYDIEMEDRSSDKADLPKRLRYYNALHDTKFLGASTNYGTLPEYVSITISSYDPFSAGDMYYEANTTLTTHPKIAYKDGITHIFLYCKGVPNIKESVHSKKMAEMLKYILSGEKPISPDQGIEDVDKIVSKVKSLPEVTKKYMKQWDREQTIQREAYSNGEKNGIQNITVLFSWLFDNGRGADVEKASKDSEYLSELFEEYDNCHKE